MITEKKEKQILMMSFLPILLLFAFLMIATFPVFTDGRCI